MGFADPSDLLLKVLLHFHCVLSCSSCETYNEKTVVRSETNYTPVETDKATYDIVGVTSSMTRRAIHNAQQVSSSLSVSLSGRIERVPKVSKEEKGARGLSLRCTQESN